ncbi:MAG: TonB-dependent receptor, partial [Novosphingobium sp.]|nr:TonB-dependent receptor [Novosphingobium sp.]
QVLKGPQGTLFGRNATGGAVLYSTRKPDDEFGGYLSARFGNFSARHVEGAINMPVSDGAALRVAGSYTGGGAFVKDYYTRDKYGDLDQKSVRATLEIDPGSGFRNTTVGQYTDEEGTNTPYLLWSVNGCGSTLNGQPLVDAAACALSAANPAFTQYLAAHPKVFQGSLEQATALQRSLGPWTSLSSVPPTHEAENYFVINTTEIDLGPDTMIKNIFGYNKAKAYDFYDYDGSPFHFFETQGTLTPDAIKVDNGEGFRLRTRQISNELQLQGKALDGRLDYVVGFYYLNEKRFVRSALDFGNFNPIAAPFRFFYTANWENESKAGFAQATFGVTDQLNVTGGFRYTWDKTTMQQSPDSLFLLFFPDNVPEVTKTDKPSWTVSVDYKVSPELMLYVSHRGSYRAGGFNYSVAPIPVTAAGGGNLFLPETTKDIELGLKYSGDSIGTPVTFNVDVFQQWVNNIQRAAYILTPAGVSLLTANVPKAKISGLEFDLSVRPSEWAQFGVSGNYTKARYTRDTINVLGESVTYGPFADVPKWSGTAFMEVGAPLGGDTGNLRFRADVYGQTKMPFSNTGAATSPETILPGYVLANARLTWEDMLGSTLATSLFVRNIFDEKYYTGGNAGASGGSTNVSNPGMPRMYGIEGRFTF